MTRPRLLSVRVGRPLSVEGAEPSEPWMTSFFKSPVEGPVLLRQCNLDGDEQADLRVHGGPDKAVCVYSAAHYPAWRRELEIPGLGDGGFGENFTVAGQTEAEVSIGDEYEIGEAVVQVSQPRSPCWKLARRWQRDDLPRRVLSTGRTGWYLRVLREGRVTAGDAVRLSARPHPAWTVARVNALSYAGAAGAAGAVADAAELAVLASLPALSRGWRLWLARRVHAEVSGSEP